jgi:hypothetical protein
MGIAFWAGAVVGLQYYRVLTSIRRSRLQLHAPIRGFWNMQSWVQLKCLLLLFLIPFLAWLVRSAGRLRE